MKRKFEGKEEYFMRNGALLLEKQIASSDGKGIPIRIFTAEELNKATNNYDTSLINSRIQSTVYKGNLDGQIVAVKTPERLQVSSYMINFFLNQAVTQIQINHKHVVKLLGCCLETEIPILVQEFIPNGSLANHITSNSVPISWSDRLHIATQIADAVTYIHCVNSNPIIHRDIRPNNILFDKNYVPKLSNFGLSVVIPPGKTAGCHDQIVDASKVEKGERVQSLAYATLALKCVQFKGEERPTMMEVAKELRRSKGIT
ncbi:Wall-associated receptor kinase-like [Thalictrum thalictroides]|uniref:Wall-associated receptor kinase-like n=1 Tax=Thalictrum thalictroides TaxID=46969 RepID=A0A7J6W5D8_THATH|nr:Wall-associated receptor kinase-like [Thalictrum thalictroides]